MLNRTNRKLAALVGLGAGIVALTGCSAVYEVTFHVTLATPTTAPVRFEVIEYGPPVSINHKTVVGTLGTTAVTGVVGVCCSPEPTVSIQAYLDLNRNGTHEAGEPIAQHAGGRQVLTKDLVVNLALPGPVSTPPAP